MPPPKLPPRDVPYPINQISRETWAQLIDAIAYAMTHPAGDGAGILNAAGGVLKLAQQTKTLSSPGGGSVELIVVTQNPNAFGPAVAKKITINPDGSKIVDNTEIPVAVPHI